MAIAIGSEIWCLRFRWSRVDGEGGVCDGVVDKGGLALEASARGGRGREGIDPLLRLLLSGKVFSVCSCLNNVSTRPKVSRNAEWMDTRLVSRWRELLRHWGAKEWYGHAYAYYIICSKGRTTIPATTSGWLGSCMKSELSNYRRSPVQCSRLSPRSNGYSG